MEHIDTVVHTLMTGIKTYVSSVTSKGFLYKKKKRKKNESVMIFIYFIPASLQSNSSFYNWLQILRPLRLYSSTYTEKVREIAIDQSLWLLLTFCRAERSDSLSLLMLDTPHIIEIVDRVSIVSIALRSRSLGNKVACS